jgi:arsenite methyltransferase
MAAAETTTPDYGLDAPLLVKRMFTRAAWTIAIGIAIFMINRSENPGPAGTLLAVFVVIGLGFLGVGGWMWWSSKKLKLELRDRLIEGLELKGDEKVIDAGCGRGLMTIGAAKRLKAGRATGVDVWDPSVLSGNSADAAKANAKLEGVGDKARFETGDIRKLTYPEKSYDVAIAAMAIHNFRDREDRDKILRELWRVLKPGGRLLIVDIFHVGEYESVLRAAGAQDVTVASHGFLWCLPTKSIRAAKA